MKHKQNLTPVFVCILFFNGCAFQKKAQTPLKTVNFNYAPIKSDSSGAAKIGIILISPSFDRKGFTYFSQRPFTDFKKSLEGDLEEMITSRGFTFRGPFNGYDEITYSDKKATQIVIEVEINPSLQSLTAKPWIAHRHFHYQPYGQSYNTYTYSFEGRLSLSGTIKLTFSEVMSHEKINIRNVSINNVEFDVKTEDRYDDKDYLPVRDPGFYNPLVTAMEEVYGSVLQKTWGFFDPAEITSWIPQIEELRDR